MDSFTELLTESDSVLKKLEYDSENRFYVQCLNPL